MKTAYFYLTPQGEALAERLCAGHPGDLYGKANFKKNMQEAFLKYDNLVCIMATGIVFRILAPMVVHKTSDPAVVVLDQEGRHAISLLSGHLGGANDLAREMAWLAGGDPVITTATDVAGIISFDSFAKSHNMAIENIGQLKHISGALLEGRKVRVISNYQFEEFKSQPLILETLSDNQPERKDFDSAPDALPVCRPDKKGERTETIGVLPDQAHTPSDQRECCPTVVIDEGFCLKEASNQPVLYLRPRTICAGIGCKRNMDGPAIEAALLQTLKEEGLSPLSLKCISTIPLKADEAGILSTAEHLKVPVQIIDTEDIDRLELSALGIAGSDFVAANTGVLSVSTASSYLAAGRGRILRDKARYKGITIALSQAEPT